MILQNPCHFTLLESLFKVCCQFNKLSRKEKSNKKDGMDFKRKSASLNI